MWARKNYLQCVVAALTLGFVQLNAQTGTYFGSEKDHIIDSLRKAGTPESDLPGYSKYLLNKRHNHQHSAAPQVFSVDSVNSCYNPDFELGNLTNWSGFTGNCCPITASTPGIVPGRHTIMSGTGKDPHSQNNIPVLAPGGSNFSVRLGNDNSGSEAEKLIHKFKVTPQSTSFTYQYAVVLQDPQHEPSAQPRFEVTVKDQSGTIIPCGFYSVTAAGNIPGFISIGDIRYRKWATVGVDLSKYMGQTVSIEFTTGDCSYGGHFGYAYIDATCEPLKIKKKFCIGDLQAILTAPDGFESYSWSTGHNTQSITIDHPKDGDTIWATLTSVTGCPTKLYAVLVQDEAPKTVKAWGDTLICPGSIVQLHATGATDYLWTTIPGNVQVSTLQEPFVAPMNTTTYLATVSNVCGSLTDTVKVSVKPYTPLVAFKDTIICLGKTVQLSVTGNANCTWSPAATLSCTNCINPVAAPTITTTYTVTATDNQSGCVLKDSVKVKVDSINLQVYAGQDVNICKGESVYLGASVSGASHFSWTPKTNISCDTCVDAIVNPATTTTYYLTASNHCATKTDSVKVTVFNIPVADAGPDTMKVCFGDVITLQGTGGVNNQDYRWTPVNELSCSNCPNPILTVTHDQTFYLSVTNAAGCFGNDQIHIKIKSKFHSISKDTSICEGGVVKLVAVEDSLKPLIWTPATGLSCVTCPTTYAKPLTSATYKVIGTDPTGCKGIDSVVINVVKKPIANAGPDKDLCMGDYVYLPGSGNGTYSWSPNTNITCLTCSNPQVNPSVNSTYYLVVTNMCGKDTDTVNVIIRPIPKVNATPDSAKVCQGYGYTLYVSGALHYTWTPTTELKSDTGATVIVNTVPQNIIYYVTGTDKYGCKSKDSVKLTTMPLPQIDAGTDKTICLGQSVTLTPTGWLGAANNPTWSPVTNLSCVLCVNPVANPGATTTYGITVTNPANGCKATDYVQVKVNYPPTAVASADQTICQGEGVSLQVSGGDTYTWLPATALSCTNCNNPVANPQQTITYTVTAVNPCGSSQDQVVVNVKPNIPLDLGPDVKGCIGDAFQLQANGGNAGVLLNWIPAIGLSCSNCTSPIATPIVTTTYTVSALNPNGCSSKDEI